MASGKPVASSFTVKDGSSSVTVSSVSIDGAEITLTLGSVIQNSSSLSVGYTASDVGRINDATGNLLGSTDTPIAVNLIKDTDAPTIKSAKAAVVLKQ